MEITNHKVSPAQLQPSDNLGDKFEVNLPDTIVIHFTGGRDAQSSANWLCNEAANASAHIIIDRNGDIIQLVDFDTIAWHAGKSSWEGRSGLNAYSIGIEIDNAGRLEKREEGFYTWLGTEIPASQVVKATHRNESTPSYWQTYTEAQIQAVEYLCSLLMDNFSIKFILGHEEISLGRKEDPGPAFPLDKLRNSLLYGNRASDESPASITGVESKEEIETKMAYVTASLLNIRSAPNASASKVAEPLKKGTL